jgi:ABC-type antimicrobial peptide transport system permease subunit
LKTKEKIKSWLLIVLITTLIGSFVLFFLGYYMISFVLAGIFMALATFLGQWYSHKNAEYMYRNIYNNNKDRR